MFRICVTANPIQKVMGDPFNYTSSNNLLPEGTVARSEQRVLARVPAQEMWCIHVFGVRLAASPHFVQQQRAGYVNGPVQIIANAALFFS